MMRNALARRAMMRKALTREAGFTVVETLLALTLLAILSGLAIPAVAASSASARLERATAEYIAALREARSNAITESVPWSVTVPGPGEATYVLARLTGQGVWQTDRTGTLEGVQVTRVSPAGSRRVAFSPSGGPEFACDIVLTAGGRSRTIAVAAATGRVTVSP